MSCLLGIYNIPADLDSFSLREFFSHDIEKSHFILFHFKNRPELNFRKIIKEYYPTEKIHSNSVESSREQCSTIVFNYKTSTRTVNESKTAEAEDNGSTDNTKAGFLTINSEDVNDFVSYYDNRPWEVNVSNLEDSARRCQIIVLPKGISFSTRNNEFQFGVSSVPEFFNLYPKI